MVYTVYNPVRAKYSGFTLAELLIALAILGMIATFTIPKILMAQQQERDAATTKETISSIAQAYQLYLIDNVASATTKGTDLTPFLNYVRVDTSGAMDYAPCGVGSQACGGGGVTCLLLHNGSTLYFRTNMQFNGITSLNALKFTIDPDSRVTNGTGDTGLSQTIYLYTNGNIKTRANIQAGTTNNNATDSPMASCDPSWFHW